MRGSGGSGGLYGGFEYGGGGSGYTSAKEAMNAQDRINGISCYGYNVDYRDVVRMIEQLCRHYFPGMSLGSISEQDFRMLNEHAVNEVVSNSMLRMQKAKSSSMSDYQWQVSTISNQYFGEPMSAPKPKKKHYCENPCKTEEYDFYSGLVTYYELLHPALVKELKCECGDKKCLVERIKNKLKK